LVLNGKSISPGDIAEWMALVLSILAIEWLTGFWRSDFVPVIITADLTSVHDGIGLGSVETDAREYCQW
jgi:hypothetical protein